jgi:hypothetical protein
MRFEVFGVDNVLFASDVPFEPAPGLYIRETIRIIDALDITKRVARPDLSRQRPQSS